MNHEPSISVPCSDSHGTPHAVCYGISAYESNCMKSSNPHSGIYVAETSRTLDLNGGNPACNQGGIAVCEPMILDMTHANDVLRVSSDGTVPTLQHRMGTGGNQVPLVAESKYWNGKQVAGTLSARNAGGQQRMPDKEHFQAVLASIGEYMSVQKEVSSTLLSMDYKDSQIVTERKEPSEPYLASGKDVVGALLAANSTKLWLR